ncbi:MAG: POTRA domain-containing protein [Planctomycetaceae bacterium]
MTYPIAEVRIEGNRSIPTYAIERLITQTRIGRPVQSEQIRKDKTALLGTRWFISVRERVEVSEQGPVVVFEVLESPRLERVEFIGNSKFSSERLTQETGLVPGHGFDVSANQESVQRVKQLYREKGYFHCKVTLKKGGHPDDREVVMLIEEGPKVVVGWVSFSGNRFVSGPVLKTKLSTKSQWFMLFGGKYNPELIQNDIVALKSYYEGLGFFDVQIDAREKTNAEGGRVYVEFVVQEGMRYQVRNIEVVGNSVLNREQLLRDLKLRPGDPFNTRFLQADTQAMKDQYDTLGRPFASVQPVPRFLEQPGTLDLVYEVDEDQVMRIGRINIRVRGDHTHTRTDVVRHRINRYLKPGQLATSKDIQAARTVVATDPIFDREDPPSFEISQSTGEDYYSPAHIARGQDMPLAFQTATNLRQTSLQVPSEVNVAGDGPLWSAPGVVECFDPHGRFSGVSRPVGNPFATQAAAKHNGVGQTFDWYGTTAPDSMRSDEPVAPQPMSQNRQPASQTAPASTNYDRQTGYLPGISRQRRSDGSVSSTPVATRVPPTVATAQYSAPPTDVFPTSGGHGTQGGGQFGSGSPMPWSSNDTFPIFRGQSIDNQGLPAPQNYLYEVSPQGDPYGNALRNPAPGFVDVDIDVTEGRTGRIMFGAGINSNAGLVGSAVLQEDNFDILRWPTSWGDLMSGRAFRGGGQSFRIEAVPGTEVSRYSAAWRTPYFLGTDFSFGVDGFFYNRFYENWTEDRLGGRLSLGYIINRHWSAGVALRMENVEFRDFANGPLTPQLYRDVAGDNFLSTVQFRIAHDTRDSAFLPSKGHMVEFAYEQAFGEFTYPRFDLTGTQYFTIWERPDGSGKHIVMVRGEGTWTGDSTPVFERLYAGGFQSFRGFEFRGVTPKQNGFRVGGQFLALGSLEYQFPITAGEGLRGVVFSDFGTVENDASFDNFRITAGFGFRLAIAAMGPAPLAFDFAFPIKSQNFDDEQVFSFYIGTSF